MIKQVFFLIVLGFISLGGMAQNITYISDSSVQVAQVTGLLKYPWAGGINSAFFSKMDLNNDNTEDLVLFDRSNHNVLTFLAVNQQYLHAPYYQRFFPYIDLWMLLRDYNKDGKRDIFTNGPDGVRVFKNISDNSTIKWQLVADPLFCLTSDGSVNLTLNATDVPSVDDVDNDGDIDIINFYPGVGSTLLYQRNMSMDLYNNPDSLVYHLSSYCWGGITENTICNNYSFGGSCPTGFRLAQTAKITHIGAGSLLIKDLNGDLLPDLLVSKVTCQNLAYMQNVGNIDTARFSSLNEIYPPGTLQISFPDFPGVYMEDLDFDGVKDIVATQAQVSNSAAITPGSIDFENSCWLYHNSGSNNNVSLNFIQKNFIQNQMIDWGENAMPAFADYDADGDLDMFVGQRTWGYNGQYSSLKLYENIGTKYIPFFELKNENYLNLLNDKYYYIKPLFTDLNGDSALDLTLSVIQSSNKPPDQILYYLNQNGRSQPLNYSGSPQVLPVSYVIYGDPIFYDLDNDNDKDLLIGQVYGNLSYFENTGSPQNPSYTHITDSLGGINVDTTGENRYYLSLTITDINKDGKNDLVTADDRSELIYYSDFSDSLYKNNTLYPNNKLRPIYINKGGYTNDTVPLGESLRFGSPDLNADGYPELVIGTNAGGLILMRQSSTKEFKDTSIAYILPGDIGYTITIFPNPASNYINITATKDFTYYITDILGRILIPSTTIEANTVKTINTSLMTDGLYIIRFMGDGITTTRKFIVRK